MNIFIKENKPNFTENIYQNQKKKIQDILDLRKLYKANNNEENLIDLPNFGLVVFNDILNDESKVINWDFSYFVVDNIYGEETPIISKN